MNYEQLLQKLRVDLLGDVSRPLFAPGTWTWVLVIFLILALIGFLFWFFPVWNVWSSRKSGQAQLAEAEYREQVAIAEARARLNSAEMNKQAEVIEAEAVAKSIETIGDALKRNEGYLRWQWIKMMDRNNSSTIYVPTEANLPILEAGKRNWKPSKEEDEAE